MNVMNLGRCFVTSVFSILGLCFRSLEALEANKHHSHTHTNMKALVEISEPISSQLPRQDRA